MEVKTAKELFRRKETLIRSVRRMQERYDELEARATGVGAFRYDRVKVTCSQPEGSKHEKLVTLMVSVEEELREKKQELEEVQQMIQMLAVRITTPRIRRTMIYRHVENHTPEECMKHFGYDYETYREYYKKGTKTMQQIIDATPKI